MVISRLRPWQYERGYSRWFKVAHQSHALGNTAAVLGRGPASDDGPGEVVGYPAESTMHHNATTSVGHQLTFSFRPASCI